MWPLALPDLFMNQTADIGNFICYSRYYKVCFFCLSKMFLSHEMNIMGCEVGMFLLNLQMSY